MLARIKDGLVHLVFIAALGSTSGTSCASRGETMRFRDLRTPWIPSGLDGRKLQSNIQLLGLLVDRSGFLTLCGTPLECWARDRQAVRTWPDVNTPHESDGLQVGHTWWIAHVFIGGAVPI